MLRGVEYLESDAKRRFDVVVAHALRPARTAARLGASASFGYEIHRDTRVGQGGRLVEVPKIKTLDERGVPLNAVADSYRKKALDELEQLTMVEHGDMSMIGTRHLLPDEYDMIRTIAKRTKRGRRLLARHDDIVMPAKRGLLSTFALNAHVHGEHAVERRLALDVHDHENASFAYDLRMIMRTMRAATTNELVSGIHRVVDHDASVDTPRR